MLACNGIHSCKIVNVAIGADTQLHALGVEGGGGGLR